MSNKPYSKVTLIEINKQSIVYFRVSYGGLSALASYNDFKTNVLR